MKSIKVIPLVLLALAVLARCVPLHALHLPDPTLAALFVLGVVGWSAPRFALVLLVLLGVDGVKFALGASTACLSPGYPLLFVSYGVMGGCGHLVRARTLVPQLITIAAATALSYAVSSGGYYLLSGRFAEPSWLAFAERLAQYLPNVLIATCGYGALALMAMRVGQEADRRAAALG